MTCTFGYCGFHKWTCKNTETTKQLAKLETRPKSDNVADAACGLIYALKLSTFKTSFGCKKAKTNAACLPFTLFILPVYSLKKHLNQNMI